MHLPFFPQILAISKNFKLPLCEIYPADLDNSKFLKYGNADTVILQNLGSFGAITLELCSDNSIVYENQTKFWFYTTDQLPRILDTCLLYGWKGNFWPIPMQPELLKSDIGFCLCVRLKLQFLRSNFWSTISITFLMLLHQYFRNFR